MKPIKKITLSGLLSAFALIAFMLENLFPPLFVVGGRLGIANFFVLFAGVCLGFWYGAGVLAVKSIVGSVFVGNASAILYSLPAGVIAYALQMILIHFAPKVSVIAASVLGGVMNACLQNLTFCLITATPEYIAYIPYLALVGVIGGGVVGTALYLVIKSLPKRVFNNSIKEQEIEHS